MSIDQTVLCFAFLGLVIGFSYLVYCSLVAQTQNLAHTRQVIHNPSILASVRPSSETESCYVA